MQNDHNHPNQQVRDIHNHLDRTGVESGGKALERIEKSGGGDTAALKEQADVLTATNQALHDKIQAMTNISMVIIEQLKALKKLNYIRAQHTAAINGIISQLEG